MATGSSDGDLKELRAVYRVPTEVLTRQVRDETVLLNVESEEYFGLDAVGTRMWEVISETGDPETVIARLLPEYEVEEEQLRKDLADLLQRLRGAGLLAVAEGDHSGPTRC